MFESFGYGKRSKQFIQFTRFIDAVRNGKRSVMFGPDYVVLDKPTYDDLVTRATAYTAIVEAKKIVEDNSNKVNTDIPFHRG